MQSPLANTSTSGRFANRLVNQPFLAFGCLALIGLGCCGAGLLLSLFQAPLLLGAAVYLGLLYVVWLTTEALFLSQLGLALLLFFAVARRPWPVQWDAISAWNYPRMWAATLLVLWLLSGLFLVVLAQTSQVWQQRGGRHWRFVLTVLCGAGLGLGMALEV